MLEATKGLARRGTGEDIASGFRISLARSGSGSGLGWRSVPGYRVPVVGHDARSLRRCWGCGGSNSAWTSVLPQSWSGTWAPGAWLAVVDVFTTTVSLNRGCGRGHARRPDPGGSMDDDPGGDGSDLGVVSGDAVCGGAPGRSGRP